MKRVGGFAVLDSVRTLNSGQTLNSVLASGSVVRLASILANASVLIFSVLTFSVLTVVVMMAVPAAAQVGRGAETAKFVSVDAPAIAITHVRVIDGTGANPRED